jgi:hypothetical protein
MSDVDAGKPRGSTATDVCRISTEQTLYFDDDGLLARHDYSVEISANTSAAHYVSDYDEIAGIKLPTKHRIFPRDQDGQSLPEPLIVSIDLSEIAFD